MARCLLVKASHRNALEHGMVPPLGLLYLAAVLQERGRHEVRILDLRLRRDWKDALRRCLLEFDPQVVGISAISMEYRNGLEVAREVRAWRSDRGLLVGGPHASALPRETLRETAADAVIIGEAEEVIEPVVQALAQREPVPALPGVVTPETDGPLSAAPRPDLDSLPLPAWELIEIEPYFRYPSMTSVGPYRYMVMATSRGCPFHCVFCHEVHGKRVRVRNLDSVADEVSMIERRLGRGMVDILDDLFNLRSRHAQGVLEIFAKTDGRLRPAFGNGLRADHLDKDLLDLLRDCRSPEVSVAIESASPRIQKAIGKNLNLEAARHAIRGIADRGLYSVGFFMLGFPGETREEMEQTIRFSVEEPVTHAQFHRVIPFPGTALASMAPSWAKNAESWEFESFFSSRMNLSAVSDEELQAMIRRAYCSFYLRPRKVIGILKRHPFKGNLVWGAAKVLKTLSA